MQPLIQTNPSTLSDAEIPPPLTPHAIPGYSGNAHIARTLPHGSTIFRCQTDCHHYLWVRQGSVRVSLMTACGKELLLYRVNPGESCMLTTTCLMSSTPYPAQGVTEGTVTALLLPKPAFEDALTSSEQFRSAVFGQLGARLAQVISRIESVKYRDIDARLAQALLMLCDNNQRIRKTHQQVAAEIGTTREVTSRHLKSLEKQQLIKLGRGSIVICNPNAIKELSLRAQ